MILIFTNLTKHRVYFIPAQNVAATFGNSSFASPREQPLFATPRVPPLGQSAKNGSAANLEEDNMMDIEHLFEEPADYID